ncbi:interleukin-3 receptor subunit alpha-like isoform X3 [Manis pentadactyla]|uniref:interleukin-3 receptor subunit alpha-like isoform X3 n=1 Tax=Manis pentadactyla TaxID=143292 RepID=UPI00255CAF36|nr:interleukin-3 receptor subunit alpha-like isoform X3 [Manis pentadactyla]
MTAHNQTAQYMTVRFDNAMEMWRLDSDLPGVTLDCQRPTDLRQQVCADGPAAGNLPRGPPRWGDPLNGTEDHLFPIQLAVLAHGCLHGSQSPVPRHRPCAKLQATGRAGPGADPPCGRGLGIASVTMVSAAVTAPLFHNPSDPESPIMNLRMEPRNRTLTWNLNGNVSKIECAVHSGHITKAKNNRYCQFYMVPSCEMTNYSVTVTMTTGQLFSTSILYPMQEGNPRAAAQDLHCRVHDVDFLTCHWVVGSEAPDDVQYCLYMEDLKTYAQQECLHYGEDPRGTHVRCYFNVTGLPKELHFLVKGTSRGSSIPCSELWVDLMETERLRLPNITARCNKSLSVMEWKMASHFNDRFVYKLQIRKGSDPPYTENLVSENSFVLYNPGIYTVRLQAQGGFQNVWSEWSATQRFECDPEEEALSRAWLAPSLLALVTLLALGLVLLICTRYSVMRRLLPPIPRVKDPIGDSSQGDKMMVWEAGRDSREDCAVAEVQVVGET